MKQELSHKKYTVYDMPLHWYLHLDVVEGLWSSSDPER
jgi:hypothetical protein